MHIKSFLWLAFLYHLEEDGLLWTNGPDRCLDQGLIAHVLHIDKVETLFAATDDERKLLLIEAWQRFHQKSLNVAGALSFDVAYGFPMFH